MVINSILNPDSTVKVHITKSKFFLEKDGPFDPITNATVQLYANDKLIEALNSIGNGYYAGTYKPLQGDIIKIIKWKKKYKIIFLLLKHFILVACQGYLFNFLWYYEGLDDEFLKI